MCVFILNYYDKIFEYSYKYGIKKCGYVGTTNLFIQYSNQ